MAPLELDSILLRHDFGKDPLSLEDLPRLIELNLFLWRSLGHQDILLLDLLLRLVVPGHEVSRLPGLMKPFFLEMESRFPVRGIPYHLAGLNGGL